MKRLPTHLKSLALLGAFALLLATLSGVALVGAQTSPPDGGLPFGQPSLQADLEAQAVLGSAFTYQGQLKDGGGPVDGTCDLESRLWDSASSGTQVGSTQSKTSVAVSEGYFTVSLDFGPSAFNGDARWLGISVRCPASSGAWQALSPRQPLSAAPYALHAKVAGNADTLDGQHGSAFAGVGHVHGAADLTSGTLSTDRYSASADLSVEGFLGNAAGDLAQNNGLLQANLNADTVDGQHAAAFVGTTGPNSVSGTSASPILTISQYGSGRALEVNGAALTGELTTPGVVYFPAKTDYYSLSGEAFQPWSDLPYRNSGGMGGAYVDSVVMAVMTAPVNLPHGATVTEFRVHLYDNSASDLSVSLDRMLATGGYNILANVSTSGTPGNASLYDDTIADPTIDNANFGYLVYVFCSNWDGSNLRINGVSIKYTLPEAH